MADYQAHIKQAKKNLAILSDISKSINESWDWQVTCCYYIAVHLVNAHIATTANLHYKTHEKVKVALFDNQSTCKIPDDVYTAYVKLENLSRRARYLCHDDPGAATDSSHAFFTYDKHLKKAIVQLDKLLGFFKNNMGKTSESLKSIVLNLNPFPLLILHLNKLLFDIFHLNSFGGASSF